MKHLFLVRHAKSSWDLSGFPDIDRPLNERGYRDSHRVGKYFSENTEHKPDMVLCSPAIRTYTTALIFLHYLKFPVEQIVLAKSLYESGLQDYISTIADASDKKNILILFGHNPTISELVNHLTGKSGDDLGTCHVATLSLSISSWKKIGADCGQLENIIDPKDLEE